MLQGWDTPPNRKVQAWALVLNQSRTSRFYSAFGEGLGRQQLPSIHKMLDTVDSCYVMKPNQDYRLLTNQGVPSTLQSVHWKACQLHEVNKLMQQ